MQDATNAIPQFRNAFNSAAATANNGGLDQLTLDAVSQLQGMAGGQRLGADNAQLNDLITRLGGDITGAQKMAASAGGRMGWEAIRALRTKPWATWPPSSATPTTRPSAATQDAISKLGAIGEQRYGNLMAAPDMLASAYKASQSPYETMYGVGAQQEDLATRIKNDEIRKFEGAQNQGWNQLQRLQSILMPTAGLGGTTATIGSNAGTQSTTAQGPNRLSSTLGGALGGFATTGGPWVRWRAV